MEKAELNSQEYQQEKSKKQNPIEDLRAKKPETPAFFLLQQQYPPSVIHALAAIVPAANRPV